MKVWITKYALTDGILDGEALEKHCVLGFGITKSQTEINTWISAISVSLMN